MYYLKKIDPNFVATQSSIILNRIIRRKLNFKGLIISDDICMRALKGDLLSNAKKHYCQVATLFCTVGGI